MDQVWNFHFHNDISIITLYDQIKPQPHVQTTFQTNKINLKYDGFLIIVFQEPMRKK